MPKKGGKVSSTTLKKMLESSYKSRKDADENIDGMKLDKSLSTKKSKVYVDDKGHAHIVHRGTTGTVADWTNNLAYVTGMYKHTDRFKKGQHAQNAVENKYGPSNVSTYGHSQGAVLARELGKKSKNIITVNPASLFVIRSSLDPISFIQRDPTHTIKAQSFNPITEHSPSILDRVPEGTEYGSGLHKIRKVHKKEQYHIKFGGKIISTHKSRKLAECKLKKLSIVS